MKRIKHRDLTHYFITDHQYLPRAYVASCERFFKSFKRQAPSAKLQAASATKRPQLNSTNKLERL